MKILHIAAAVHKAGGGTSEVVPRLCRALKEIGHEVVLAVIQTPDICQTAQDALAAGVKIVSFKQLLRGDAFAFSPAMRRGLREWVAWADIVHIHGLWQAPIWYGAAECLRQHKPFLMMPHGFIEPERLKRSKWKKRIIGALFDRRYLRQATALVATAASEAEGFRQYGLTNPVHIMPIGLDLEQFDFSRVEVEKCRKKRLLYFSRVTPIKGLDMLMQAWKRLQPQHPDWELVITGPDDRGYTRELQSYITSLGLTYTDTSTSSTLLHGSPTHHSSLVTHHSPTPPTSPTLLHGQDSSAPIYKDETSSATHHSSLVTHHSPTPPTPSTLLHMRRSEAEGRLRSNGEAALKGPRSTTHHSSLVTHHSPISPTSSTLLHGSPISPTSSTLLHGQNSPSSIIFTGPVYGDAKFAALRSADAFVLPTRSENWSIAVAEAMATALPVVCTKGAPWSCINACGCGHWVDVSTDAIHAGLEDIMSLPDARRVEMGLRGRRWVEQNLDWSKIAESMARFYLTNG